MGKFLFNISTLIALVLFSVVLVQSRTLTLTLTHPKSSSKATTTLLDVASSNEKTTAVLSSFEKKKPLSSTDDSLVLQLHPRSRVHRPKESNYRSLTLSRVERDSVRVNSLLTRLDLALRRPNAFSETPVISGTSEGSGEYFARIGIGTPPSHAYVVLDTGSDVTWVQCAPCAECYRQSDPIFDPAKSSSFSPIPCGAPRCRSLDLSQCGNGTCLYEVSYGDGSYTFGAFATDTVTLGAATAVADVAFGCGHTNEGLFVGAAGLLGLGGGALSFAAQVGAGSFSYCLVDRDSDAAASLEFDAPLGPAAVTAPLRRNPVVETFYYIALEGMSVGGESLPASRSLSEVGGNGDGGIIVDSGTAVTRLRADVYDALRDAFLKGTRHLESVDGGVSLFDTCYDLSSVSSVEVPTVSFLLEGGRELSLPAKNFMIPIDSNGTYCLAFAPTTSTLSIIGNVQQQGTRVGFDLVNSVIGFVPGEC